MARSTRRPLDGVAAWVVRPTHRSISTQVRRLAREGAVRPPPRDPGRRRGGRLPVQSRGGLRRRVPGRGRGPAAGAARVAGQRRRRAGPCPPVHRAERGLLKKGRATSTSITAALGVPAGGSPRSLRLAAPKAVAAVEWTLRTARPDEHARPPSNTIQGGGSSLFLNLLLFFKFVVPHRRA